LKIVAAALRPPWKRFPGFWRLPGGNLSAMVLFRTGQNAIPLMK
jgi:hypothetical protein